MRKILLSVFLLSFSFTAYMPTKKSNTVKINDQIKSLVNDGYSLNWAIKKVLVENNVIKADAEYYSIIED